VVIPPIPGVSRLQWTVQTDAGRHRIDLLPGLFGRNVTVRLDDRRVARIRMPTPQHPLRESTIRVDDEPITIVLTHGPLVPSTDVFRGGRSLLDGRSLEDARASAPPPVRDYDVYYGFWQADATSPIVSPWRAVAAMGALAILLALVSIRPRVSGPLAGAIVLLCLVTLVLVWLGTWFRVVSRAQSRLVGRDDLGDGVRTSRFWAVFVGFPVLTFASFVALLAVVSALGQP
jgi:hypothetical protein